MSAVSHLASAAERRVTVRTADGVALAAVESGPRSAALTVVLVHGHCSRTEVWADVRSGLARQYPNARVVSYDHRGHGESGTAPRATYNLEQLGHDLHDVLDVLAPSGPVVLVGHSMGGMTILTYLAQNAHEIGSRITGVALIATAAGDLADAGFGRLLQHPIITGFQTAVRYAPRLMQRAKRAACKVFAPVVRAAEFGNRTVSPRVLALVEAMHNETSIVTMASFLSAFRTYDRTDVLPLLSRIPTVILCGTADLMTPPSHAIAMAAAVDYSDLVLTDGAGHSVILEQPTEVVGALTRLLTRATAHEPARHLALAA